MAHSDALMLASQPAGTKVRPLVDRPPVPKLSREQMIEILRHRLEGLGIRKTARLCKVGRMTVLRFLLYIGEACAVLLDRKLRNLSPLELEIMADELWAFVKRKERRKGKRSMSPSHGNAWGFIAMHTSSRAILWGFIGKRCQGSFFHQMAQLRARIQGKPHFVTDKHGCFPPAIRLAFGSNATHSQMREIFERSELETVTPVDLTVFIERLNLTVRHENSKFKRRSLEHAKSWRHLCADFALWIAFYNFVRPHSGIEGKVPAVALGLIDEPLDIGGLLDEAMKWIEADPVVLPAWATMPLDQLSAPQATFPGFVDAGVRTIKREPGTPAKRKAGGSGDSRAAVKCLPLFHDIGERDAKTAASRADLRIGATRPSEATATSAALVPEENTSRNATKARQLGLLLGVGS